MLLYFLYEVYMAIETMNSSNIGKSIGTLVDACISLFVAVYLFINVRKANITFREKEATSESNNSNQPES
jgi:hypothetical protein